MKKNVRLIAAMASANMKSNELARKANLSNQYICDLRRGRKKGSRETWVSIAKELNVSLDWLLDEKELL